MNRTYYFGDCKLEVGKRDLWRGGKKVKLSRMEFDVLVLLIEQRDRAVEKDAIIAGGWGPDDDEVTDASLSMLLSKIRRALGDSDADQKYIETKHGYGYSFCGKVRIEEGGSPQSDRGLDEKQFWLITGQERFGLPQGDTTLGRCSSSPFLFVSSEVSRDHARLTLGGSKLEIADLGSRNGTFVNGKRIQTATVLRHGDKVKLADVELRVYDVSGNSNNPTETLRTQSRPKSRLRNRLSGA